MPQLTLIEQMELAAWPAAERFPLNAAGRTALQAIRADLDDSETYRIFTGYTSLEYLVELFGRYHFGPGRHVEIVLGNEPARTGSRIAAGKRDLPEEIRDYWLEQGVSIVLSDAIIRTIEHVKAGRLRFRILPGLHAKIYLGDRHAIAGSSNFSRAGLTFQKEVNLRYESGSEEYEGLRRIAANYRSESRDYTDDILKLLHEILQEVSWQEALARAVAELLEGKWIEKYPALFRMIEEGSLWPSQRQAIAQALWVLDTNGSVLIADPTGSGKTRVGVILLYSLVNRLWASGRSHRSRCAVICPPQVRSNWTTEMDETSFPFLTTVSQGLLSHHGSERHRHGMRLVKSANVLFVDEAHNYLNRASRRSQSILASAADHIALLTATPINRQAQDLLRLIELLGLDNLSGRDYRKYVALRKRRKMLTHREQDVLREYVRPFTVRRTKSELNEMIERKPEAYRDRFGHPCRYPRHDSKIYETGETKEDRELARQIDDLASRLRGLLYLRRIHLPDEQRRLQGDARALVTALSAARALARYNVRAALRSSVAAVVEHVYGTKRAAARFRLPAGFKSESGDVLSTLEKQRDAEVDTNLSVPLPEWLSEPVERARAIEEEQSIYRRIAALSIQMSDGRQLARVQLLEELFRTHRLVLAYDSRLITLAYLEALIEREGVPLTTEVVTGARVAAKRTVNRLFGLGSEAENVVALCSDAMSEGVNLQQASAVVFLDSPSVIRIAEQRVGRVDRMDSPHASIEVYWPNESEAFALRASKRFVERYMMVDRILGTNMPIPDEFLEAYEEETIDVEWMIDTFNRRQQGEVIWDGLQDAFQPVRELVGGLVPADVYEKVKSSRASVFSKVSLVRSQTAWGFFAIRGSGARASRWVLIEESGRLFTELPAIAERLRAHLAEAEAVPFDEASGRLVHTMVEAVRRKEEAMLPNKRRHALDLMKKTLKTYASDADDPERLRIARRLLHVLDDSEDVDLYDLAQSWLDVVQPLFADLRQSSRKSVLRLRDLRPYLKEHPIGTETLRQIEANLTLTDPLDKRIAACIIGLPGDGTAGT